MSIASPVAAYFEATTAARAVTPSLAARAKALVSGIVEAISLANERRAHREIGRFIVNNGGVFNDTIERQLGERFSQR
ncbi:hypothetical protein [Microvirga antarctica]|uniref:hypothetical protein n=1 Tax=Microvirga antarctica TaxID=2819233 RepID=UPI001B31046E|nr:hypothetical protein [Microvirga antarctica]